MPASNPEKKTKASKKQSKKGVKKELKKPKRKLLPGEEIRLPVMKRIAKVAGHRMVQKEVPAVMRAGMIEHLFQSIRTIITLVDNRGASTITEKDIADFQKMSNQNKVYAQ